MVMDICTNGLLNCNDIIGQVISSMTTMTTGDIVITFLLILAVLVAFCLMFGIRLEYTMIIIFPSILALMTVIKDFYAMGVVMMIYLAVIMTYNFVIR